MTPIDEVMNNENLFGNWKNPHVDVWVNPEVSDDQIRQNEHSSLFANFLLFLFPFFFVAANIDQQEFDNQFLMV